MSKEAWVVEYIDPEDNAKKPLVFLDETAAGVFYDMVQELTSTHAFTPKLTKVVTLSTLGGVIDSLRPA